MRPTSHSQCFYRKGKRALEHKQLDNNLIQHAFPMGDFTNKMSWASYTNLGAKIGGETSALPRADDVCPYVPSTILLPLSHRSFFSFQLEKCFQFLNHFFLLISTPNSPQSFLIVQDNEKQILKKSITPKCISKVEQAPICKSSELPGEETCGCKEFRF